MIMVSLTKQSGFKGLTCNLNSQRNLAWNRYTAFRCSCSRPSNRCKADSSVRTLVQWIAAHKRLYRDLRVEFHIHREGSSVHLMVAHVEVVLGVLVAGIFYYLLQSSVNSPCAGGGQRTLYSFTSGLAGSQLARRSGIDPFLA